MDRFDDIWKNRFNEESNPIDSWNTPDDLVWDAIAMGVPIKEKQRKWWLIWLGLGLLASVSLAVWGYHDMAIGSAQKEAEAFEKLGTFISGLPEKQVPVNIKKKTNLPELSTKTITRTELAAPTKVNTLRTEKANQSSHVKGLPSGKISQTQKVNTNIITPEALNSRVTEIQQTINLKTNTGTLFLPKSPEQAGINFIDRVSKTTLPSISSLAFLNVLPILPLVESTQKNGNLFNPVPKEAIQQPAKNLTLALNSGALFWQHRISDNFTSAVSAFDFNYSDNFGWQGSVQLQYSFNNKFSLISGLQYESVQSTSGHNSSLSYDPKAESTAANNEYSLDLATPYGFAGADFLFRRTQEIGEEEVDLLVDFKSVHQIHNWSLPLLLQINPLGQNRKFSPLLTIGGGVNYLSGIKNSIQSIDTHHDAIQYEQGAANTDYSAPNIKKWHFDYRLGAGFQYRLNTDLQIQMNYQWARGINPIFEQQTYKTKIDRHQLSLGLVKKIRL